MCLPCPPKMRWAWHRAPDSAPDGMKCLVQTLRQPSIDDFLIEGGVGLSPGRFQMLPRFLQIADATVKLAKCPIVQVVAIESIVFVRLFKGLDSRYRPFNL